MTAHAIQRFQERVRRLSDEDARAAILACLANTRKASLTADGQALVVRTKEPYALRIVIDNHGGSALPQVTTVMPGDKGNAPSDKRKRVRDRVKRLVGFAAAEGFVPLQVTAHLAAGYAASDDWSPALDGILAYWIMRERSGDDFAVQCSDPANMVPIEGLPLMREVWQEQTWWLAASPLAETVARYYRYYHRRFDDEAAAHYLPEGFGRVLTAAGPYKSSRLRHVVRVAPAVVWHCIGNAAEIERLLKRCRHIGRGYSSGLGVVTKWEVTPAGAEWPATAHAACFRRPLPADYAERYGIAGMRLPWGLRPPGRLGRVDCVMPPAAPAEPAEAQNG